MPWRAANDWRLSGLRWIAARTTAVGRALPWSSCSIKRCEIQDLKIHHHPLGLYIFRDHLAQRYGIRVEKPAHVLVKKTNFCIHARRWIVERTFAWLSANRRLSKEYDRNLRHANTWITLANIKRVLKFC